MKAEVVVSPTFLSWVFQFGDKVKILDPEDVVSKYKQYLTDTISIYKNISQKVEIDKYLILWYNYL